MCSLWKAAYSGSSRGMIEGCKVFGMAKAETEGRLKRKGGSNKFRNEGVNGPAWRDRGPTENSAVPSPR